MVPPLSSGPRGPGEGLCLQDPGLLALGSGLAHHLRCSRLGSGLLASLVGLAGRGQDPGVQPLSKRGKQAQTLLGFPGPSCAGGTFPLATLGGGCGFGLASPPSCLRLPISAVVRLCLPPTSLPRGPGTPRSAHLCSPSPTPQRLLRAPIWLWDEEPFEVGWRHYFNGILA